MREWLQDLRYGARMIVKRPGTSAIAIVALALGIGLTTTMFSIVQGVILRGLPFDRERTDHPRAARDGAAARPARRRDRCTTSWTGARSSRSFESLAGYSDRQVTISGDTGFPERLRGVAHDAEHAVGPARRADRRPRLHRTPTPRPARRRWRSSAIALWQARFKGDPNVAGHDDPDQRHADDDRRRPARRSSASPSRTRSGCRRTLTLPVKRGEGQRLQRHRPARVTASRSTRASAEIGGDRAATRGDLSREQGRHRRARRRSSPSRFRRASARPSTRCWPPSSASCSSRASTSPTCSSRARPSARRSSPSGPRSDPDGGGSCGSRSPRGSCWLDHRRAARARRSRSSASRTSWAPSPTRSRRSGSTCASIPRCSRS